MKINRDMKIIITLESLNEVMNFEKILRAIDIKNFHDTERKDLIELRDKILDLTEKLITEE